MIRATGKNFYGVRGTNLSDRDEVIVQCRWALRAAISLIVSEKGMGKLHFSLEEFTTQNRGGKGVKCYKITEKTGNVVGMKAVNEDNEIMINTTEELLFVCSVRIYQFSDVWHRE